MFKFVNCPLCNDDDYLIHYESTVPEGSLLTPKKMSIEYDVEHLRIVICNHCGMQYSNPIDRLVELNKNYRQLPKMAYLDQMEERFLTFQSNYKAIKKYKTSGRLLDIGCSVGLFLNAAKEDMEVYGVELSEITSRYAREHFGLNVMTSDVEGRFESGFFDVVTMWDMIEHVFDPKKLLFETHRILKDDGIVCISTPYVDGMLAKVMGKKWIHYIRTHLTFFSTHTLHRIFTETGFEIISKTDYSRIFTVTYFVKRAMQHNLVTGMVLNYLMKLFRLGNIRVRFNLKDTLFVIAKKKPYVK